MIDISKDTLRKVLKITADRTMELSFLHSDQPGGIRWRRWDWSIGVAFHGIGKAYDILNDERYIKQMKIWIDERIDSKIEKVCVNSNSLLLTVLRLNKLYKDERYLKLCETFDDYLLVNGPRTPSNALEHTVLDNDWSHQVWADTLFMSLLYLVQRGDALQSILYLKEASQQLDIHCKLLFDPEESLFYHGWNDMQRKMIGVHWGRGNAWMTAGTVDILELLPADMPERLEILNMLGAQVERLSRLQDESGLWRTVLNHEDTYLETSVTAGVGYGMMKGIRLGLIDNKYTKVAERALAAVVNKIDTEGNVLGGSSGTPVKANALEYNNIPYEVTPFTQGLALLAIAEGLNATE